MNMSRIQAVNLIRKQLEWGGKSHGDCYHYGKQELRELMDAIYGSKPKNKREMI